MHRLRLEGCRPEPLMSYLKALGVFRLIAEQKDERVRGAWANGAFEMILSSGSEDLVGFFLSDYSPTPIVAPWAGGSGFFQGDNRAAVDAIAESGTERLGAYREIIERVRKILKKEKQSGKPSGETKEHLLHIYRRELGESFVEWMDCALVLQNEGQAFPPLLGTGGNDGRLDFTQNFMQRLVELGLVEGVCCEAAEAWLRNTLFGEPVAGLSPRAVGQFDPGRIGGPNATQGMEGSSLVNPWDYVLMMEGATLLAGSVARRMGALQHGKAAFPFTVAASSVGHGSMGPIDPASARGETWLPLWERPASMSEVRLIFSEGRTEISGKQSRDAVDFARAVAGLGVDRGLSWFVRFGFLKRSGKAYLAPHLGHLSVRLQ